MLLKDNLYMFKVGIAESKTGHVFKIDFTLYLGQGEMYTYFTTLKEAILFSNQLVKENSQFECWVSNESDEMVYFISSNEERFY